ncbi:hypothetical protein HZU75_01240 [Chitinibacter fontanus]|uniref:Uncharacterized protein n=1 Tax=Chitinibacter fontanus TaxID=1737446 RepID=A0A7D5Z988_9NEIS|nr:hypothetical protein [Chitinibacter fontanus]QLI80266.1 hypothetical protein HZU75_01240 [Chitinibacter fontanus]
MNQLDALIKLLCSMEPVKAKKTHSEKLASKTAIRIILISAVLLFVLLVLAGVHEYIGPLPNWAMLFAQCLVIACMLLPMVAICIELFFSMRFLLNFKSWVFDFFNLEIMHDKKQIALLQKYDKVVLEEAQQWLQLKITRINNKIGFLMGNSEKVALFALIGTAWAVWEALTKDNKLMVQSLSIGHFPQNIVVFILAFLTGLAVGAVLMNAMRQKYIYFLELVTLALAKKK